MDVILVSLNVEDIFINTLLPKIYVYKLVEAGENGPIGEVANA